MSNHDKLEPSEKPQDDPKNLKAIVGDPKNAKPTLDELEWILAAPAKMPTDAIRVMKIRVEESGPDLYLPESQKDNLWAYVEDWAGKVEIRFITMTQAELDALPEFDWF